MANGSLDLNCCYHGGSWAGQCGAPETGLPYRWQEGFRACNNMTLTPEPERIHVGRSYVPLASWIDAKKVRYIGNSTSKIRTAVAAKDGPRLHAYILTLQPEKVKVAEWQRRLSLPGEPRVPLTVLRTARLRFIRTIRNTKIRFSLRFFNAQRGSGGSSM